MIKPKLFYDLVNIYGITPGDYIKCYGEIKAEMYSENNKTPKEEESHNLINRNENDNYNELKTAERMEVVKNFLIKIKMIMQVINSKVLIYYFISKKI